MNTPRISVHCAVSTFDFYVRTESDVLNNIINAFIQRIAGDYKYTESDARRISAAAAEMAAALRRVSQAMIENTTATSNEAIELRKLNDALNNNVIDIKARNIILSQHVASCEKTISDLNTRLGSLQEDYARARELVDSFSTQVVEKSNEIERARASESSNADNLRAAQRQVDAAIRDLEDATQRADGIDHEFREYVQARTDEIADLRAIYARLDAEHDALKREYNELTTRRGRSRSRSVAPSRSRSRRSASSSAPSRSRTPSEPDEPMSNPDADAEQAPPPPSPPVIESGAAPSPLYVSHAFN